LAVKAPGFGDRKKETLQDIAVVSGANYVSEDLGKKLDSVSIEDLGSAHRVVSNKDNTTIVGGKGDKQAIADRVAQLKAQLKKTDSEFDKEKIQERLGKLAGGVAVIKVGAPTESAQKELKQRVEDAVAATRAAMEEGIVPGGGVALWNAYFKLREDKGKNSPAAEAAHAILMKALESPISAIVANSGESPSKILSELMAEKSKNENLWTGFNALTNKIGDLKEAGIVDPLKVVKTALLNAVSVASTYLTIGAAVSEIPKKETPPAGGSGMEGMDY
ncbi:MAG: TCP-1/cpn60 chaperonin family protein, partial [Patescibacteria group bacterium]